MEEELNNQGLDFLYDKERGEYYMNCDILSGIASKVIFSDSLNFEGGFGDGSSYVIGSGSRAEVIRALGFSDSPTQSECWAKMETINIEAYPGKRITIHKDLVPEVQNIFKLLKNAGVELNQYIGGYCFRPINNPNHKGSKTLSMHSFGCAIDINYNLNGFVAKGRPLTSGDDTRAGKIRTVNSPIVKAFERYGWGWGGRYGDYMHFSKANGG